VDIEELSGVGTGFSTCKVGGDRDRFKKKAREQSLQLF
jgi:hypothetical protein